MAKKFTYGRTEKCCNRNCGSIATNWSGVLRKSRDFVKAGFCEEHTPEIAHKDNSILGIYHKGLGFLEKHPGNVFEQIGLNKNSIEQ
jgi:hypothetical protein